MSGRVCSGLAVVADGVRLQPAPGAADDVLQVGVTRFPAEFAADAVGAGDGGDLITGATGEVDGGQGFAGDGADGFDDLADGLAATVAEVVDAKSRIVAMSARRCAWARSMTWT